MEVATKNSLLGAIRDAQIAGTKVFDQIVAYGEDTSGGIVWLSDFQNITYKAPSNGQLKMNEGSIILDINQDGILYGFKIVSNDGLAGSAVLEDAEFAGFKIEVANRSVTSEDAIEITETVLGADSQ